MKYFYKNLLLFEEQCKKGHSSLSFGKLVITLKISWKIACFFKKKKQFLNVEVNLSS